MVGKKLINLERCGGQRKESSRSCGCGWYADGWVGWSWLERIFNFLFSVQRWFKRKKRMKKKKERNGRGTSMNGDAVEGVGKIDEEMGADKLNKKREGRRKKRPLIRGKATAFFGGGFITNPKG